jgi:ferric-dicitrate binding protein FerR (iron transport regulator)
MYEIWKAIQAPQAVDEKVAERMYGKIASGIDRENKQKRSFFQQSHWKVAASVTGILLVSAVFYFVFLFSSLTTHTTAYGETEVIRLSDGTIVHLYANSKLSYSPEWEKQREVWLEGEGYFKVQQVAENNSSVPQKFIVHTSNLDVEVLGTEFNVKDRRGNTQIVLNSGAVKLTRIVNDIQELTMAPGDIVEVGQLQKLTITKVAEPAIYSSWKDNYLYFEDMTLAEIAGELKDSHGIQMIFKDAVLAAKKINASTPVNDLSVLFTTIQKSFDLKVRKSAQEYIISEK